MAIRIADIVITDDALGTNNLSLSGADAASFEIVGNELRLRAGTLLDFETKASFDVTVEVDDTTVGTTPDDTASHTLNITDINEAPTVSLTNLVASLAEDTDTSTAIRIADIVITDDDLGTNNLSLSGADAASFEIVGSELRLRAGTSLDFETTSSFDVTVEVDDATVGGTYDDTASHTLNITDVNDVTPEVTPGQNFTVAENSPNTTIVGTVVATDGDATLTTFSDWTIVGGSAVFEINGNGQITVSDSAQLPTANSFILTVTVSDGVNVSAPETVTIYVMDINEAPYVVNPISDVTANEDGPDLVIDLSTVFDDPNLGDTLTFSVVQNTNATLITATITNAELTLDVLDNENGLANLTIRATDSGALFVDYSLSVTVLSVTEQINVVGDAIQDLIDSNVLTANQANPLTGKLESATDKLNDGNTNAGINQLNAFINQVQAFINSGKLTQRTCRRYEPQRRRVVGDVRLVG